RLNVIEVVEHQAADSHCAKVHQTRGLFDLGQAGVLRMEGQRNERLEAASLVLELAQANQMIDPVKGVLEMAVKHCGVAAQAELMSRAVDVDPATGVGLVLADLVAHFGMEDFGTAAGKAPQPGCD